jgi:hypothetical protein
MGLEKNNEQHYREVVDKYVNPQEDYEMTTYDYVVRPYADPTTGPITITLPRVAEAKGRFYGIACRNADPVNTVTITDRDDSECWANDLVFNGKCDRCMFYSDGLLWWSFCSGGWPQALTTFPPGTTQAPTTAAPDTTAAGRTTAAPTTAAPTTAAPTTQGG